LGFTLTLGQSRGATGQALQVGLTAGEAQREDDAKKAIEAKAAEKKRER
jgi:hypothetical protein